VADTPNILTPLQRRFLNAFSQTELKKDFFLTGGTALAHFYLQHRLSDDLDFFTEVPGVVAKDFVDVYFLCQEFMPFDDLFANTQKKHVGLDEYWIVEKKS
jgi:predicted nucleotidyltransferase component of viral defense system